MDLFIVSMVGRVMVIVGVLVPMLMFQNLSQNSPTQIAFWVITVVGLTLWIFGRFGEKISKRKEREKAAQKDKVDIEL